MDTQKLFTEFRGTFKHKYTFADTIPLGTGQDVVAYKGFDIDRQVNVAIKIYLKGEPPVGSERDWKFTSGTIHPQIAPTFTIESFKASDGNIYKVVVARFIPGETLRKLLQGMYDCTAELQLQVANNIAKSLIPSLLNAIEVIHTLCFGHGDLTDGNIMTFLTSDEPEFTFAVVLLDFDNNAPSRWTGETMTDKEMMESDIRSLKQIIRDSIQPLGWADTLQPILDGYENIKRLKMAYHFMLKHLRLIESQEHTVYALNELFKELYIDLGPHYYEPLMEAIRNLSVHFNLEDSYNLGHDQFLKNKSDYDFQRRERKMTVYKDIGPLSDFYRKIYG